MSPYNHIIPTILPLWSVMVMLSRFTGQVYQGYLIGPIFLNNVNLFVV